MAWTPFSAEAVRLHGQILKLNAYGRISAALDLIVEALERAHREGPSNITYEQFEAECERRAQERDGPVRVQLRRTKGWRMPPNTVKVDRTTRWGNDFIMAHEGTRALAVAQHAEQARAQAAAFPGYFDPLRGRNLACWCPLDRPCHADVLLELANAPKEGGEQAASTPHPQAGEDAPRGEKKGEAR